MEYSSQSKQSIKLDSSKEDKTHIVLKHKAVAVYLLLGGLFIAFLVFCNLVATKFIALNVFWKSEPLILSCGVLPYPATFLITDLLSEFYGKRRTAWVVFTGLIVSVFIVLLLQLMLYFPAVDFSPATTNDFDAVFGNSYRVIGASLAAYLMAQLVDVHIYEFWRKVTKGKYLWIRNNGSTIFSQFVDTTLVVVVLFVGVRSFSDQLNLIIDGWTFKIFCALADTPIIYGCVYLIRRYFGLKAGEEIKF